MPAVLSTDCDHSTTVEIGDEVWIRPGPACCTTQCDKGTVTRINSKQNLEVDGMPRHVLDIRPVVSRNEEPTLQVDDARRDEVVERRYSGRDRRPPIWMGDYVSE